MLSVKLSAAVVRIDLDTKIGYRYPEIQRYRYIPLAACH